MLAWLREMGGRRAQLALAVVAGALYGAGFCGFEMPACAWFCLVPLLWAVDDVALRASQVAALMWLTGLVAHLGCYTWIVHMLRAFAFLPLPLAVLGYALLCVAQSSLFAAVGWLWHGLTRRCHVPPAAALPCALVLAEWAYPALFPSYFANSQYRVIGAIQGLDLVGVLGLSGLLAATNAVLYQALAAVARRRPWPWRAAVAVGAVLLANWAYGRGRIAELTDSVDHADRQVTVGLVQANMGIYEKTGHPEEGLRRHRAQSLELERQGAQLIVWPESGYYYALDEELRSVQHEVLGPVRTPVLFGGLRTRRGPQGRELFNSAFMTDAEGNLLGSYDKTYLLVFGEYLPLGEALPWLYRLSPQTAHFSRGRHTRPLTLDGVRYGVLICYEGILPRFTRQVVRSGAEVLVNLTNDAWYGRSREPRIHLALAALRAVEHRRFLVRATNTGISAIVDPLGRIVAETPTFSRANLLGEVTPLRLPTVYGRGGDWVALLCLGLTLWWGRGPLGRAAMRRWPARLRPRPAPARS